MNYNDYSTSRRLCENRIFQLDANFLLQSLCRKANGGNSSIVICRCEIIKVILIIILENKCQ